MDQTRDLLRHTVATVAYRASKALRGSPPEFAEYRTDAASRTPAEILAHMGDLFDWALSIAKGKQAWHDSTPLPWHQEVNRFFGSLSAFDDYLASEPSLAVTPGKLFQGPIADALTHVGQLSMLRRLSGAKVRGENFFIAEVAPGRTGLDQAEPRKEFD